MQHPSMAQSMAKEGRTGIGFMNGFIAEQGARVGRAAPAHQVLVEPVRQVERSGLAPSPDVIRDLLPA